jgi:hypothetical protein
MGSVTIEFRGICTHFWNNTIHGVPHRVVMPDATPLRGGVLQFADSPDPLFDFPYFLLPHFPFIQMDGVQFDQSGIVEGGLLGSGSHLRVINAVDNGLSYDPSFVLMVPQLTTFLKDYTLSNDVVTGGRTSAYFDIFSGTISAYKDVDDIRVRAVIETVGPPKLRVTAMKPIDETLSTVEFTLPQPEQQLSLSVGNSSPACLDGCYFDFLLHYLTEVSGIPAVLKTPAPGMPGNPYFTPVTQNVDPVQVLEDLISVGFPRREKIKIQEDWETTASCSDSRYP